MIIFGIIGLVLIIVAIFIEDNRKQAKVEFVGGIALLVYSISIHNVIFIILQACYILAAGYEILKSNKSIKSKS